MVNNMTVALVKDIKSYFFVSFIFVLSIALPSESTTQPTDSIHLDFKSLRTSVTYLSETYPKKYPDGKKFLYDIAALEKRLDDLKKSGKHDTNANKNTGSIIVQALELQRNALTANPLVSEYPIIFVVREQYKPDHHNTATIFQAGEVNTASFSGGGALKVIDFGNDGKVSTLIEVPSGIVRDPEVHFSGEKIVFSLRENISDDYHIYEVNRDGTGLRQVTSAAGVSDIDPLYLPDDDIVFSSTREPSSACVTNI